MGELKQNLIRDFKETVPYVLLSLFVAGGIVSLCLLFPETGLQVWLWLFAIFLFFSVCFVFKCFYNFFFKSPLRSTFLEDLNRISLSKRR